MNIYFAHGKESGPWGAKIQALAEVAKLKGFIVESSDYRKQPDPDARVEQLLNIRMPDSDQTILVGSSMGGYVATVASKLVKPVGLFLMAPAFNLPGYKVQNPEPCASKTVIIHGLKDEVVPVENSIRFASEHKTELHLLDSDHQLKDQISKIEILFSHFLDEVVELSDVTKIITWEKLAQTYEPQDCWIESIWRRLVQEGKAYYKNETERNDVMLRFIALADFYAEFMSGFSKEYYSGSEPREIAKLYDFPNDILDALRTDFITRHGHQEDDDEDDELHFALHEIAKEHIYPIMLNYYGDTEKLALSIYRTAYPTYYDEISDEYLSDPEDPDADENARLIALDKIKGWLVYKIGNNGVVVNEMPALAGQ